MSIGKLRMSLLCVLMLAFAAGMVAAAPILLIGQGQGTGSPTEKIVRYSLDGAPLGDFATGLAEVGGMMQAPTGDVYVTEYSGRRVKRFSNTGTLLGSVDVSVVNGGGPGAMAWANGLLYVNSVADLKVLSYNPDLTDGPYTHGWGVPGYSGLQPEDYCTALTVGSDGKLYSGVYGLRAETVAKFVAWTPGETAHTDYVEFPAGQHPATGTIYDGVLYTSEYNGTIYKSEGGGPLQSLFTQTAPYGLTVYNDKIYVVGYKGTAAAAVKICNLDGTPASPVSSFSVSLPYARTIAVVDLDLSSELGALTGNVTLESFTAGSLPVAVKIELIRNGSVAKTAEVMLDAEGNYTIPNIDGGTYDAVFKAASYLRKVEQGITVPNAGTGTCNTTLTAGDLDNDNEITTTDVSATLININKTGD